MLILYNEGFFNPTSPQQVHHNLITTRVDSVYIELPSMTRGFLFHIQPTDVLCLGEWNAIYTSLQPGRLIFHIDRTEFSPFAYIY